MDTVSDHSSASGSTSGKSDTTDRPSSRLGVDGRSETPSRCSTPLHLKRIKRQAPKPPTIVTSGAGLKVTLTRDESPDTSDMSDQPNAKCISGVNSRSIATSENQGTNANSFSSAVDTTRSTCSELPNGETMVGKTKSDDVFDPYYQHPFPGVSRVMVRLIDEEESYVSESACSNDGEPRPKAIHAKLSASPYPLTTTTTTTVASQGVTQLIPTTVFDLAEIRRNQGGLNDILTNGDPPDVTVRRGRARRLMHSASDPGVSRARMNMTYNRPPMCTPTPPPLEQLSEADPEEEYESISTDYPQYTPYETEIRRALSATGKRRLERSDSLVTVAHICEDLMVAPRLKVKVTLTNMAVVVIIAMFFLPNTAFTLYKIFGLVFGTLFPAYYSYKAVKTKNVKEYVQWMMYWIVFAFFSCFETITDVFLSFWFPFYYEIKILVVLWLLSPATRGSSILYRKFVHPWLTQREDHIDDYIAKAKQQGYSTVVQLGTKGVNYATNVIMQTALKSGGGVLNQLRRSYSTGEIVDDTDAPRNMRALTSSTHSADHHYEDLHPDPYDSDRVRSDSDQLYRARGSSTGRIARANKARSADISEVYYQDAVEEPPRRRSPRTQENGSRILVSSHGDDLTSGYSSGDIEGRPALRRPLVNIPSDEDFVEMPPPPPRGKRSTKVRRTQSMSVSGSQPKRPGLRVSSNRLPVPGYDPGTCDLDDDLYCYSGHGSGAPDPKGFKRSRPGDVSAYATLPRSTAKRTQKKRQV